jgi:hypothetical protein
LQPVRVVKVGLATAHEEITAVGHVIRYRLIKGAPVRDYTAGVALKESHSGGTVVSWDARFRPLVPGTGWALSLVAKHTLTARSRTSARRTSPPERRSLSRCSASRSC